jgi:hypothetical protein
MPEELTDREKALEARIAELEAVAKGRALKPAGGNIVEQVWHFLAVFVPTPILLAGVAVFACFHVWSYYTSGEIAGAETNLKAAQRRLADAEATGQSALVGDLPVRIKSAQAEVEAKRAQAARAQTEADAMTSQIDGEALKLKSVRAQVELKQANAEKARQAADAATATFGVQTLTDRAAFAKLVSTELNASNERLKAAYVNGISNSGQGQQAGIVDAVCTGNMLAKYIGCPARYVHASDTNMEANTAPPETGDQSRTGTVSGILQLTLRSCPTPHCDDLGHIPQGLQILIDGDAGGRWLKVRVKKRDGSYANGFVNGRYIQID